MVNMSLAEIGKTDKDTSASDSSCSGKSEQASSLEVSRYFRWNGILDRGLAAVLLVPGIPIIGLSVALVRLASKGPGIYCQTRVGKDRRIFTMYKIRTMRHDAEDGTGPVWTKNNDDHRITPVGRFLRNTHLDEFPQLFNVLKGEMSLIGPRPERPEFVSVLAKEIPNYLDRIEVRPGITGLAQINLEPDVDVESVCRKLVLDTEYIKHATVFFDARMLLVTLLHLVGCNADWAKRITGLKREVARLIPGAPAEEDDDAPAPTTRSTPRIPTFRLVGRDGGENGSGNHGSPLHGKMSTNCATEEAGLPKPR
jgi:lipopolysaccharide/colanic/teichoic acid biosynthesis glycosyltransferase